MAGLIDPLPEAPPGAQGVVFSLEKYADLRRFVNAFNNFTVEWPLQLQMDGQGVHVSEIDTAQTGAFLKLTSINSPGTYNAKTFNGAATVPTSGNLAASNFGTLASDENAVVLNAAEIGIDTNMVQFSAVAQQVFWCPQIGYDANSSTPIYGITIPYIPNQMFKVLLSQTAGGPGSSTTQASWSYTVTDLAGDTLGTAMTPEWPRPAIGYFYAATQGIGYFDTGGNFILSVAYEYPSDVAGCG